MREAILVTSIGAKSALLERVYEARTHFDPSLRIIGADSDISALGRYIVDEFWLMPSLQTLSLDALIVFCKEHKVRYIIPTRDGELAFFALHKEALEDEGIFVFVASYESVMLCYDKLMFYEKGAKEWAIPTSLDPKTLKSDRYVIKERFGGGAQEIALDLSKEDLQKIKLKEPLFQPYIKGKEYSIDSYVDQYGVCVASVVRSRDKIVEGEAKITTVVRKQDLQEQVKAFVQENKILFHSVTQVIEDQDGVYHLIECNTRFGGASTLSYELGLESFLWFLQECNHQDLVVRISEKRLTQVRMQKDLYFES